MQLSPFSDRLIASLSRRTPTWVPYSSPQPPKVGDIVRVEHEGRHALMLVTVPHDAVCRGVLVSLHTFFATHEDILVRGCDSPIGLDFLICTWFDVPFATASIAGYLTNVGKNLTNGTLAKLALYFAGHGSNWPRERITDVREFTHTIMIEIDDWDDDVNLPTLMAQMVDGDFEMTYEVGPYVIDVEDDRKRIQVALSASLQWVCATELPLE